MIVCRPNLAKDRVQDNPAVLLEVLSEATRERTKDANVTLPTLSAYVLVETDRPHVVVHRRGSADGEFTTEVYEGTDAVVPIDDIGCTLNLADPYARLQFNATEQ